MSVFYEELTPRAFQKRLLEAPIAYLPLGTLEWHGEHLPLGSDGLQSRGFFARLAEEAGGIVLPMIWLGPDRCQIAEDREFYGMDYAETTVPRPQQLTGSAYWIPGELYIDLVRAILKQLRRAGFRIVVAHGHGPSTSEFRNRIPAWQEEFGLRLFICWRGDESDGLGIQTDHAAANETSLMMALHPDLVHMANLPDRLEEWPRGVGGKDPRVEASAERGRRAIDLQVARMAPMLREALRAIR